MEQDKNFIDFTEEIVSDKEKLADTLNKNFSLFFKRIMATQNKIDNVKDDIKAIKERLTHIEKNQREIPDKIINAIAEAFEESIGQMNKDINALKKNSNTITKGIDDIKKMLKN